jgi:cytidylate kinase
MRPIVAIDGPAGTGKSTIAKRLALELKLPYLDTGAMYRWVAFEAMRMKVSLDEPTGLMEIAEESSFDFPAVEGVFQVAVNYRGQGVKILGNEIRSPEVSMATSDISRFPELRRVLVKKQQEIGSRSGAVCEGRDAGTVIFPQAPIKFFMTARPEIRAGRRHLELLQKQGSQAPSYESVLADVLQRDQQDAGRAASPMRPAADALLIDTSDYSEEEVFFRLLGTIRDRLGLQAQGTRV